MVRNTSSYLGFEFRVQGLLGTSVQVTLTIGPGIGDTAS